MSVKTFWLALFLIVGVSKSYAQTGVLDSTFGANGMGQISFPDGGANKVIVQPDGKILLGGIDSATIFALARYKTNGTLDSTFGNNGTFAKGIGNYIDEWGDMALQPDGKIVLSGNSIDDNNKHSFILVRFNSNGTIDSSFNKQGFVFTAFNNTGYGDYGEGVAVQPDGKIVQVGMALDGSTIYQYFGVVRYNADGSIDNTFGNAGKVMTRIIDTMSSYPLYAAIQQDGKIVVGGDIFTTSGAAPGLYALARYNANGSLDNTFGNGGKVVTKFGAGGATGNDYEFEEEKGMILQPDGKILITGGGYLAADTAGSVRTVRYNSDGSLDATFGKNGVATFKNPLIGDTIGKWFGAHSLTLQQDGKIILLGDFSTDISGIAFFSLARYKTSGALDSSFGVNGFAISPITGLANSITMQADGKIVVAGIRYGFAVLRFLSGLNTGVLNFTVKNNPVLIYPNPVYKTAELQYALTQPESITLTLYNMQGKLVQTFFTHQARQQGGHKEQLQFANTLATGNYILNISNGNSTQGVKIVKQ